MNLDIYGFLEPLSIQRFGNKKMDCRLIYKDGFKNPERGFTLPLLFICKLHFFIFWS